MAKPKKVWVSFSSGKDSMLCLTRLLRNENYEVAGLFSTYNQENERISMHGVSIDLVKEQAKQLQLPIRLIPVPPKVSHKAYSNLMANFLNQLKAEGYKTIAFGDIFLEDLKNYRIQNLESVGMEAIFPIWNIPTNQIILDICNSGMKAQIVAINCQKLQEQFLGKTISIELVKQLPEDVDICGENGEFHTFVYDGPFFENPIPLNSGKIVTKYYEHNNEKFEFKFMDLALKA